MRNKVDTRKERWREGEANIKERWSKETKYGQRQMKKEKETVRGSVKDAKKRSTKMMLQTLVHTTNKNIPNKRG